MITWSDFGARCPHRRRLHVLPGVAALSTVLYVYMLCPTIALWQRLGILSESWS